MIPASEKSLGQALVAAQLMTPEELELAIEHVENKKSPSLIIRLIESDFLKFNIFQKFLAQNYKIKTAILNAQEIPHPIVNKIGLEILGERMVIPIMAKVVDGNSKLALGMVNPLDEKTILEVETKTKHSVTPVLISLPDFRETYQSLENFQKKMDRTPVATYEEQLKPADDGAKVKFDSMTSTTMEAGITEYVGSNLRKYKEEIAVKLGLDEKDVASLKKENYSRPELLNSLRNLKKSILENSYKDLNADQKVEALINSLIYKGLLTRHDILVAGAVSKVFSEDLK